MGDSIDFVAQLHRLRDYQDELKRLALPGFGRFERFRSHLIDEKAFEEILKEIEDNPAGIEEYDELGQKVLFDYFISFPLQEVYLHRHRFSGSVSIEGQDKIEEQLQAAVIDGHLGIKDAVLFPDLIKSLAPCYGGTDPLLSKIETDIIDGVKGLVKLLLSPHEEDVTCSIFINNANLGRQLAVICLILKKDNMLLDLEWEIIEGILRSPYFPSFFEECEREAGSPEIPYKYNKWPSRDVLSNSADFGKECDKYVTHLHPDVQRDLESDDGYENFKSFLQQLATYGGVNNDADMGALLQLITGHAIDGASRRLRWNGDGRSIRILFFVIKHIATNTGRFSIIQKGANVVYVGVDEESEEFKNLVDRYSEKCDPARFLQKARGIDDCILSTLHSYYDFFPANKQQA